jgi:hypothetical protein
MFAVRLFTTLVTLPLTALAASAFYRHDRRGIAAGLLYLVYGAAFLAADAQAVNGEVLLLLPAAWALVAVRDERAALRPSNTAVAGTLLAVAALFKPQAAFWGPAIAWAIWRAPGRRGARALAVAGLAASFTIAWSVAAAVFWWAGTLEEFLYWNVTHNLRYTGSGIDGVAAAGRAAKYVLPWLAATAPLWWCAWRSRPLLEAHPRRLITAVLLLSIPAAVLGLRFFPHYFIQLYVPLALLAAPQAAELFRARSSGAARLALAWTALMVLGFTAANLFVLTRTGAIESRRPVFARVTERLRADECFAGARLFVWGFAPEFYYFTGLRPASRFVVPAYTVSGYAPGNPDARGSEALIREDHWALLVGDLEKSRATYVLDTAGSGLHRWRPFPVHRFPHLLALLRREFTLVDTVDGVALYRREGCAPVRTALP